MSLGVLSGFSSFPYDNWFLSLLGFSSLLLYLLSLDFTRLFLISSPSFPQLHDHALFNMVHRILICHLVLFSFFLCFAHVVELGFRFVSPLLSPYSLDWRHTTCRLGMQSTIELPFSFSSHTQLQFWGFYCWQLVILAPGHREPLGSWRVHFIVMEQAAPYGADGNYFERTVWYRP
ncbi:hypothetical protein HOY82DRAFT_363486 [Tuber indicum]|nr:hypothetical protein HOY82DRAFT_363486 [Tuber indicum]